jgi:thiol-disulfide isomerase/thioredoxin
MRTLLSGFVGCLFFSPVFAQEISPSVMYGRVTMSYAREYEWMDLLGIAANEFTVAIQNPVYGARLRIDVWQPEDTTKPTWSETFGSKFTFKDKTAMSCTFRLYFVPPKLKDAVPADRYPAWLVGEFKRPGEYAEKNPTGWFSRDRLAFPDNYLGIEGYQLTPSAYIYDIKGARFDHPLPFFHYFVSRGGYESRDTPDEMRKANPGMVHIIGWLEPMLEQNDFYAPRPPQPAAPAAAPKIDLPLLAPGSIAPTWEMDQIGGGKLSSDALRGKISVINFWATWCGHCIVEMPEFVELQEKYRAAGVEFVGLNTDRGMSVAGVQRFLKWTFAEKPMNYPNLIATDPVVKQFGGVDAYPTTYIVDAEGKIAFGRKGELRKAELEKLLQEQLAKKK